MFFFWLDFLCLLVCLLACFLFLFLVLVLVFLSGVEHSGLKTDCTKFVNVVSMYFVIVHNCMHLQLLATSGWSL